MNGLDGWMHNVVYGEDTNTARTVFQ